MKTDCAFGTAAYARRYVQKMRRLKGILLILIVVLPCCGCGLSRATVQGESADEGWPDIVQYAPLSDDTTGRYRPLNVYKEAAFSYFVKRFPDVEHKAYFMDVPNIPITGKVPPHHQGKVIVTIRNELYVFPHRSDYGYDAIEVILNVDGVAERSVRYQHGSNSDMRQYYGK
jgi:hypothetical protein